VLTQVAGQPVCPSDDVDQAWHLHITRTADYERFCREALGQFLHHRPAEAGASEHQRHRAMYAQTLTHYLRAFGTPPPADVWPPTDKRFAPPPAPPVLIGLPGPFARSRFLAVSTAALVIVLAVALNLLGVLDATHAMSGPRFLGIALPVTLALLLLAWLSTGALASPGKRDTLDPYEAAWLSGGHARMTVMALTLLVERGTLRLDRREVDIGVHLQKANRLLFEGPPPDGLHPVELACLAGVRHGVLEFDGARAALAPTAGRIAARLQRTGLASVGGRIPLARTAAAALTAAWVTIALERILHAMGTERPMAYLVMLTLVAAGTLLGLLVRRRATWRGRKQLDDMGQVLERRRLRAGDPDSDPVPAALLPLTLALLGPAEVLAQPSFEGLDAAIGSHGMLQASRPPSSPRGDGDGDGGGGGNGCGGGGSCGGGGCGG
jgi:uncharacterized protein (TIGR04222 family)